MVTNFKQFLESAESDFDIDVFMKNTEFYRDQFKDEIRFMYHGDKNYLDEWRTMDFKERTRPRDSSYALHDGLNAFFKKQFGFPFRNGLFVTGKARHADAFGRQTAIFPIGKFTWLNSPSVEDVTRYYWNVEDKVGTALASQQTVDEIISLTDWNTTDLDIAVKSGTEIMLKCDKYYQVYIYGDTFAQLKEALRNSN